MGGPAVYKTSFSEAIAVQYAFEVCREWGERRVGPDGIERRWLRLEMADWERALNWWPRKKARRAVCSLIVRGYMQAQIFEVNHLERRKAWFAVCEEKLKEESLRPLAQRLKKKGGSNGTDNADESGASASSDIDWADRIEAGGPDKPVTPLEQIETAVKHFELSDASSLDPDKASWFAECTKPDPPHPLDPPPGFMAVNPWTRNAHPSDPIPDLAEAPSKQARNRPTPVSSRNPEERRVAHGSRWKMARLGPHAGRSSRA